MIRHETTLGDLRPGESGHITALHCTGALRRRLLDLGLTPGCRVLLRRTAPLGDPLQLHLRGYELSLRRADAKHIIIAERLAVYNPIKTSRSIQFPRFNKIFS